MGIELESVTRIVVGRLVAPTDPERAWWWQSTTILEGTELIVAGFAPTENDALLEAAARTLDLRAGMDRPAAKAEPPPPPDAWGLNGSGAPAHDPVPVPSTSD